jgi:hypothetical protein
MTYVQNTRAFSQIKKLLETIVYGLLEASCTCHDNTPTITVYSEGIVSVSRVT